MSEKETNNFRAAKLSVPPVIAVLGELALVRTEVE